MAKHISNIDAASKDTDIDEAAALRQWGILFAVFVASVAIVFFRRPDALLRAQFYAEDGKIWFAEAYNHGLLAPFFSPQDGYFQTFPRVAALFAQFVPLEFAPLCMNIVGLIVHVLPVLFVMSSRFEPVVPHLGFRALLCCVYLLQPNVAELHVTVTMVSWRLAFLAFLILLSPSGQSKLSRVFDSFFVSLCAVTGPFSILFFPIAFLMALKKPEKRRWLLFVILLLGAALQGYSLLFWNIDRPSAPLEASFRGFFEILGGQLGIGSFLGEHGYRWTRSFGEAPLGLLILLFGFISIPVVYSIRFGSLELKMFILLALMVLFSALITPTASRTEAQWDILDDPFAAARYWFIPALCVVTCIGFSYVRIGSYFFRAAYAIPLTALVVGFVWNFTLTPFPRRGFLKHAAKFESAPPGRYKIPIQPKGWFLELEKR